MAGLARGNHPWFVVPTLVFTMLPLAGRLWTLFSAEQGWWTRIVEFAPFLIGFAAPVLLLVLVYLELGSLRPAHPSLHHASRPGLGEAPL